MLATVCLWMLPDLYLPSFYKFSAKMQNKWYLSLKWFNYAKAITTLRMWEILVLSCNQSNPLIKCMMCNDEAALVIEVNHGQIDIKQ